MLTSPHFLSDELSLSAVIPAINEERSLPQTLPRLLNEADEVLVVDGGSRDSTRSLAEDLGARVVSAPLGRGVQLQRGAEKARGAILWFVHADTLAPAGAGEKIRAAIEAGYRAGAFAIRFDGPGWRYQLGSMLATARSRMGGLALGDQAIFVTRALFFQIGGFPPWPLFEDVALWRKLRGRTRVILLEPPVTTSARRFEKLGPIRAVFTNWFLLFLFQCGVSPHRLANWYRTFR